MADDDDAPAGAGGGPEPVGDRVRIFRRGRVWYANFQDGGRQHRPSLRTTSKKQARARAVAIEARLAAGTCGEARAAATVADGVAAYQTYLTAEGRAARTLRKYARVFGRVRELARASRVTHLSGITARFVDAYRKLRADDGAGDKTRYDETVVVRQLVNFALSRGLLAADPLRGYRVRRPRAARQPCWTFEQVRAILAASPADARPAFTLLAETGLRFGELAWLTWADVEPTALRVQPKAGWRPKTGDQRAVPRNPAVDAVLAGLPRSHGWVVTMPPSRSRPAAGRPWAEQRLLAALKNVLAGLGLAGKLHTFRHAFISNALLAGTPEAVVREWVGHVDARVMRVYTHVHDAASQAAMRRLTEANLGRVEGGGHRGVAGGDPARI